jgi:DNA-binding response OmpR family regulator
LEELEALRAEFERAGYLLAKLWTEALLLRILYALGRRTRADQIFAEAIASAEKHGVVTARLHLEEAKAEDPLLELGRHHWPPRPTSGHRVRDRAIAALVESAMGHGDRAEAILSAMPAQIEAPGYGVERALASLVRGDVTAARAQAAEDGADPELIDAITCSLERISYQVIVDGQSHQLRANGRVVSLGRRRAVRRILYRLAARPGSVVSRDDLAQALWTRSYDPLVHENALKSNISNLRKLIDPLQVEADDTGYRLVVPERFLYLPEQV